jgi:hypothetical protein
MVPLTPTLLAATTAMPDGGLPGGIFNLVLWGAIGFAFFATYLGYQLIRDGKRRSWAFLLLTLASSFVFLGAELYKMRHAAGQIRVTRFPPRFDDALPLPVFLNKQLIDFSGGYASHACENQMDLTIDAQALHDHLKDLRQAELRAQTATVNSDRAFTGFSDDAGGPL